MASYRLGVVLSWVTAWLMVLAYIWLLYMTWNYEVFTEDEGTGKLVFRAYLAIGVVGIATSFFGAGMLITVRLKSFVANLVIKLGAWLGLAWAIFTAVFGFQIVQLIEGNETFDFQREERHYHTAIAGANVVLLVVFLLAAVFVRGRGETSATSSYSLLHALGLAAVVASFFLFCWENYRSVECHKETISNAYVTSKDCREETEYWYGFIVATSIGGAALALLSTTLEFFKDCVPLATFAIGALSGVRAAIYLSGMDFDDPDCDYECLKNSYTTLAVTGSIVSLILMCLFFARLGDRST